MGLALEKSVAELNFLFSQGKKETLQFLRRWISRGREETVVLLIFSTVRKVEAALLTTLIATHGVWIITRSCPTPKARDPGLHRPLPHTLNLNSCDMSSV